MKAKKNKDGAKGGASDKPSYQGRVRKTRTDKVKKCNGNTAVNPVTVRQKRGQNRDNIAASSDSIAAASKNGVAVPTQLVDGDQIIPIEKGTQRPKKRNTRNSREAVTPISSQVETTHTDLDIVDSSHPVELCGKTTTTVVRALDSTLEVTTVPKARNGRKRKRKSQCSVDDHRDSVAVCEEGPSLEVTEHVTSRSFESVSPQPSSRFQSSCEFDPNLEKDACDLSSSDDELPDISIKISTPQCSKNPHKAGDLIWVKCNKNPFWPAVVKQVYSQKRSSSRLSLNFIGDDSQFEMGGRGYVMCYNKTKVMAFSGDQDLKLREEGQSFPGFRDAIEKADAFIRKLALGLVCDPKDFFNFSNDSYVDEEEINLPDHEASAPPIGANSSDVPTSSTKSSSELSVKGQQSVQRREAYNEKLLEVMTSDRVQKHLREIVLEKKTCERHQTFMNNRSKMKRNQNCGPFANDNQLDKLVDTLQELYQSWKPTATANVITSYVLDVMLPETLVEGIRILKRCNRERAEQLMLKGPRIFKEELLQNHAMLIEQAKNISMEDKRSYTEKHERHCKAYGFDKL